MTDGLPGTDRYTGGLKQYHCNLNSQINQALCLFHAFSHCGSNSSAGPARAAWLWGPSVSHWGLLPGEPASQSHLHHTVSVPPRQSKSCSLAPSADFCLSQTQPAHQEHRRRARPDLPGQKAKHWEGPRGPDRYCKQETGHSESSLLNNSRTLTSCL